MQSSRDEPVMMSADSLFLRKLFNSLWASDLEDTCMHTRVTWGYAYMYVLYVYSWCVLYWLVWMWRGSVLETRGGSWVQYWQLSPAYLQSTSKPKMYYAPVKGPNYLVGPVVPYALRLTLIPAFLSSSRVGRTPVCSWSSTPVIHSSWRFSSNVDMTPLTYV